jgi:hypothetical protein
VAGLFLAVPLEKGFSSKAGCCLLRKPSGKTAFTFVVLILRPVKIHMAGGGDGDCGDDSICRAALREAFGDSSDSESDAPAGAGCGRWRWEAAAGVRGLWLCAAFLSADEQARLLDAIQRGESLIAGSSSLWVQVKVWIFSFVFGSSFDFSQQICREIIDFSQQICREIIHLFSSARSVFSVPLKFAGCLEQLLSI